MEAVGGRDAAFDEGGGSLSVSPTSAGASALVWPRAGRPSPPLAAVAEDGRLRRASPLRGEANGLSVIWEVGGGRVGDRRAEVWVSLCDCGCDVYRRQPHVASCVSEEKVEGRVGASLGQYWKDPLTVRDDHADVRRPPNSLLSEKDLIAHDDALAFNQISIGCNGEVLDAFPIRTQCWREYFHFI